MVLLNAIYIVYSPYYSKHCHERTNWINKYLIFTLVQRERVYIQTLIIYLFIYFQIAVIFKNLMLRLGFNKFYAQGGDWGSFITAHLGSLFPDKYVLYTRTDN